MRIGNQLFDCPIARGDNQRQAVDLGIGLAAVFLIGGYDLFNARFLIGAQKRVFHDVPVALEHLDGHPGGRRRVVYVALVGIAADVPVLRCGGVVVVAVLFVTVSGVLRLVEDRVRVAAAQCLRDLEDGLARRLVVHFFRHGDDLIMRLLMNGGK